MNPNKSLLPTKVGEGIARIIKRLREIGCNVRQPQRCSENESGGSP